MRWKEEYSVGIDEIDKQHRVLLDYFNLIEDAVAAGGTWSSLHFILVQLHDFARIHFSVEETLMHMFAYPGAAEHVSLHQGFFAKMKELEQQSLTTDVTKGTVEFLHNWLLEHIMGADKGYARHIASGAPVVLSKQA
ncbi:MAG: bacteriohemerythrin [Proteobacteria bacterium]|nr:bacteriohemerythrin [Pseudomonadota bacterium]